LKKPRRVGVVHVEVEDLLAGEAVLEESGIVDVRQ
jgi:hypothetical protein